MMPAGPEEPTIYAVRFSPLAEREAVEVLARLIGLTGDEAGAREWYIGLRAVAGTLARNPGRYAVRERESRLLGKPVRRLLYRRTATSEVIYHLFYTIRQDSLDGPRVTILHVRHAARKPLTRAEARAINAGNASDANNETI